MSVSPRQNFLKPPPVPPMPTVTLMPLLAFWNSSAMASVIGNTVEEPSIAMMFCAGAAPIESVSAAAASRPLPLRPPQTGRGRWLWWKELWDASSLSPDSFSG